MIRRSPTQTQAKVSFTPVQTGVLQRKCASCGQHTLAGKECTECQKKRSPLQRRSTNQAEPSEVPPIVHEVLRSPLLKGNKYMKAQSTAQTKTASTVLNSDRSRILQRKCESCGQHTIAGGECGECAKKKSGLQRKLAIGANNDPLEWEADRVADQVMAASTSAAASDGPPRIQRFTGQLTEGSESAPASIDHLLSSPGRPLEPSLQRDMGQRFGHDFSRVRVHTDAAAERSARDVNANAYTVGHNITYPKKTARAENAEIQTKLTVGAPNDVYEQEADRVADQVMSIPDATQQPIQREAMPEEEEIQTKQLDDATLQREAMPEEEEEIQTKRSPDAGFQAGSNLESRLNSSQGGGSPLPDEVRSFMEPRFGADFSQVRVHTGSEAVQMNRQLNAQAFTHKQDVYFGDGKTPANDTLTAHELTHVVQQGSNYSIPQKTPLLTPNVQRLQITSKNTPTIQRDIDSDLIDALVLSNWSRAANLLNQMNDPDLNAKVRQRSPEMLLGLQRAAGQAHLTRVVQAIRSVQLTTGTQVENVEGNVFRTPATLFPSGVVISKDIRFVKLGRFRSNDDFEMLKNRMLDAVRTNLTNRFKLKIDTPGGVPQPGDGEYSIRVQIVDNPSASYRMQLFGQRHGRSSVGPNSGTIFELGQPNETQIPDTVLAHESAHFLLGAHDEYADAGAPASRQVFTDHSLMGNFPKEGMAQAQLKPRHFGALVRLVRGWFPGRNISIIE